MPEGVVREVAGRIRGWHWLALDVLAASALLVENTLAVAESAPSTVGYLVAAVLAVPVAFRRRCSLAALGVVMPAAAVAPQFGLLRDAHLALALVLYTVVVRRSRRSVVVASVAALAVTAGSLLAAPPRFATAPAATLFVGTQMLVIAIVAALAVRANHRYVAAQRAQAARRAVTEERLRIARELHDVVAHSMSVITIQAGAAGCVLETRPVQARRALRAIEETGRGALVELRRMLAVLRPETAPESDPGRADALSPAATLADLDALVQRASDVGVHAVLEVKGEVRALPAGLELSAYRIAQEALTNVLRHAAGPAGARLTVEYRESTLAIEVVDDGGERPFAGPGDPAGRRPGEPGRTGHGLLGMRERVAAYGGSLRAGPLPPPRTGFRVSAVLPTEARVP